MGKIKGWTKGREDKWAITYNKDDSLKHLHIARSKDVVIGDKVNTPYIVWVAVYSGGPYFLKGATTLNQAKRIAIQFMKSNP